MTSAKTTPTLGEGASHKTYNGPRHNRWATTAPTATDDASLGYGASSMWFDASDNAAYICIDPTIGAAVWQRVFPGEYHVSLMAGNAEVSF